jgi:hypothetical protein
MKMNNIIALLLLQGFLGAFAYDSSIDAQIVAMRNASPQKRVEMMNALKRSIVKMNNSDRQRAINALRQKSGARVATQPSMAHEMKNRMQMKQMDQRLESHHMDIVSQKEVFTPTLPTTPNVNDVTDTTRDIR